MGLYDRLSEAQLDATIHALQEARERVVNSGGDHYGTISIVDLEGLLARLRDEKERILRCPKCDSSRLRRGPSAGGSTNVSCAECGGNFMWDGLSSYLEPNDWN